MSPVVTDLLVETHRGWLPRIVTSERGGEFASAELGVMLYIMS